MSLEEQPDGCLSPAMLALWLVNLSSGVTLIIDNPPLKGDFNYARRSLAAPT